MQIVTVGAGTNQQGSRRNHRLGSEFLEQEIDAYPLADQSDPYRSDDGGVLEKDGWCSAGPKNGPECQTGRQRASCQQAIGIAAVVAVIVVAGEKQTDQ